MLTSREIPTEIAVHEGSTAPIRLLQLEPLSAEAGEAILATKGLNQLKQSSVQKLVERYHGNPLRIYSSRPESFFTPALTSQTPSQLDFIHFVEEEMVARSEIG